MSWRDRAAKAVEAPATEPTKPTKEAFVSNVSSPPAPFPPQEAANAIPAVLSSMNAAPLPAGADRAIEAIPSPLAGIECAGCDHLEMRDEWHTGTRRRFWWRCKKDYELLEIRRYDERVTIAPPECEADNAFRPWKPGAM